MATAIDGRSSTVRGESRYAAFGLELLVDSRISIPGVGQNSSCASPRPSHVRLDDGEIDRRWAAITATPQRARELRFDQTLLLSVDFAEPAGYLLWTRDFGRVLISADGMELLCQPDPTNEDWASIVTAQALPLAATIRGMEVLHASGVVLGDKAVLIAGPPGAGKSSLAAALIRHGGQLLSDDAVALRLSHGALLAYPGSTLLQLRAAEDERLAQSDRAALGRPAHFADGKQRYLSTGPHEPVELGALLLLERSAQEPAIEGLPAVDPFELLATTFNLSVRTPARLERQLDVMSAIASAGLVYRLRVQPGIDATTLASIIQAQFAVPTP
jgi:hypothetical protein